MTVTPVPYHLLPSLPKYPFGGMPLRNSSNNRGLVLEVDLDKIAIGLLSANSHVQAMYWYPLNTGASIPWKLDVNRFGGFIAGLKKLAELVDINLLEEKEEPGSSFLLGWEYIPALFVHAEDPEEPTKKERINFVSPKYDAGWELSGVNTRYMFVDAWCHRYRNDPPGALCQAIRQSETALRVNEKAALAMDY